MLLPRCHRQLPTAAAAAAVIPVRGIANQFSPWCSMPSAVEPTSGISAHMEADGRLLSRNVNADYFGSLMVGLWWPALERQE